MLDHCEMVSEEIGFTSDVGAYPLVLLESRLLRKVVTVTRAIIHAACRIFYENV